VARVRAATVARVRAAANSIETADHDRQVEVGPIAVLATKAELARSPV
jgi:hypothetical protein